MDRSLIDYLPQVLKEVRELKAILEAEQHEVLDLWIALENALNDQFINDATENGVIRLESILKIVPKAADTLDDRKFRILARFNEQLPYTLRVLEKRLITLCGSDGFTMELFNTTYTLKVRIELAAKGQYDAVDSLIRRIAPANLVIDLDLRYKLYNELEPFTYGHLESYTYDQLRNEVIV